MCADFIIEDDDVLLTFLKERELNGDFIARVCDKLWIRKEIKIDNFEADIRNDANQLDEVMKSFKYYSSCDFITI